MSENRPSSSGRERRKRKWDVPGSTDSTASASVSSTVAATPAAVVPGLLPLVGACALPGVLPAAAAAAAAAAAVEPAVAAAVVQQSAAAIVQKINQGLAARGVLPPPKVQDEVVAKEIVINDAEPGVRYKLTKRQTQEDIQSKTGAVVITRGRYKPPGAAADPGGEKPLYLHISAGVHLKDTKDKVKAVDQAVAIVEEMLKIGRFALPSAVAASAVGGASHAGSGLVVGPAAAAGGGGGAVGGVGHTNSHYAQQTSLLYHQLAGSSNVGVAGDAAAPLSAVIYAGFEADRSFNLPARICGPDDRFIEHIAKETGAVVVLRGIGSGERDPVTGQEMPEPLHLHITCSSQKALDEARWLAENLMETIRTEFYRIAATAAAAASVVSPSPQRENPNHRGGAPSVAQLRMGTENYPSSSGYGASGISAYATAMPTYCPSYPGAALGGGGGGGGSFPPPVTPPVVLHSSPLTTVAMARGPAGSAAVDLGPIRGGGIVSSVNASAAAITAASGTKRYSAVPPPPQLLFEQKVLTEESERGSQAPASASRSRVEESATAGASASSKKDAGRGAEGNSSTNATSGTFSSSSCSSSTLPFSSSTSSWLSLSSSTPSNLTATAVAALFVSAASGSTPSAQPQFLLPTSYAQSSPAAAAAAAAAPSPYSYAGYAVRPLVGTTPGHPYPFGQPATTLSTHSLPASFGAAFLPGPPPLSGSQAWAYQHASSSGTSSAQTLHRPPPPVSVNYKTTSASSSGVAGSSSSSHGVSGSARGTDGKHSSDSGHPPQKRRFQEFPKDALKAAESKEKDDPAASRQRQDGAQSKPSSSIPAAASSYNHANAHHQARLTTPGSIGGGPITKDTAAAGMPPPSGAYPSLRGSSKAAGVTTASSPPRPTAAQQGIEEFAARNWHAMMQPSSFPTSIMHPPPLYSASNNMQPMSSVASHPMGLALSAGSRLGASGNEASLKLVDYGEEEDDDTVGLFSSSGKGASPLSRLKASAATAYGKPYGAA